MNKVLFGLKVLGHSLFSTGIGILVFAYVPILYSELYYGLIVKGKHLDSPDIKPVESVDTGSDYVNIQPFVPENEKFSVIIEKIGVNAPVIADVSTVNNTEYTEALKQGVAHAQGTAKPGKKGNMFLFAHSSINFWELGPYATVFNLLNKLSTDDTVIVYYEGRPYVYKVFENNVVPGWDTTPYVEEYDVPVLTMVTCDPVGTTINRRIVKAKLFGNFKQSQGT